MSGALSFVTYLTEGLVALVLLVSVLPPQEVPDLDMIPDDAWPYLASGVVAVWIVNAFLTFLGRRSASRGTLEILRRMDDRLARVESDVQQMAQETKDLHQWHDRRDSEGVPVWYGTTAARAWEQLRTSLDGLTDLIRDRLGHQ